MITLENESRRSPWKENMMELVKLILWISAGAVIGWFASRLVMFERKRLRRPVVIEDRTAR